MNDELIMRIWSADHDRFSHDLDRALAAVHGALFRRNTPPKEIDRAYAGRILGQPLRRAGNTLFGGLAALATTTVLLVVLASLAGPSPALGHTVIELAQAGQGGLAVAAA